MSYVPDIRIDVSDTVKFFFCSLAGHPDLHSFPTRRSSDLCRCPIEQRTEDRGQRQATNVLFLSSVRSEEHTSELQSPYDLVCRLLLEKKKPQRTVTNALSQHRCCGHNHRQRRCCQS